MPSGHVIVFAVAAAVAVGAAVMMLTRKNAVHAALWLALNFAAIGVLYLTLQAQFLALLQITIYAGAIMVLFLFVIMLLNVQLAPTPDRRRGVTIAGVLFGAVFAASIAVTLAVWAPGSEGRPAEVTGTVEEIGEALFTRHVFAFEFVSVLLLAAMVGVIVATRRRRATMEGANGVRSGPPPAHAEGDEEEAD